MNAALSKLYTKLLDEKQSPPPEATEISNLTQAEKERRFLDEKRQTIERLREISQAQAVRAEKEREDRRWAELEKKRLVAERQRDAFAREEKKLLKELQAKTKAFWLLDDAGKKQPTGVAYIGEAKAVGNAWVPHGHGEYRVRGEVVYDGSFVDGFMHGTGLLTFPAGDAWEGGMWRDQLHGLGTLFPPPPSSADGDDANDDGGGGGSAGPAPCRAIYRRDRRVCFVDDLRYGTRIVVAGPRHARNSGAATVLGPGNFTAVGPGTVAAAETDAAVARSSKEGVYTVVFDDGVRKRLNLIDEEFSLRRTLPRALILEPIIGSTTPEQRYFRGVDNGDSGGSNGYSSYSRGGTGSSGSRSVNLVGSPATAYSDHRENLFADLPSAGGRVNGSGAAADAAAAAGAAATASANATAENAAADCTALLPERQRAAALQRRARDAAARKAKEGATTVAVALAEERQRALDQEREARDYSEELKRMRAKQQ